MGVGPWGRVGVDAELQRGHGNPGGKGWTGKAAQQSVAPGLDVDPAARGVEALLDTVVGSAFGIARAHRVGQREVVRVDEDGPDDAVDAVAAVRLEGEQLDTHRASGLPRGAAGAKGSLLYGGVALLLGSRLVDGARARRVRALIARFAAFGRQV